MTKRLLIGTLVVALAFIGIGCDSKVSLESPNVAAEVLEGGATIHLSWEAVTNAKSYEIKAGDSTYTTEATSFDVSNPAATVEVWSVSGNSKSDSAVVNCGVVETTLDIYGDLFNPYANGFGFAENGQADTCAIVPQNYPVLDFYADGLSSAPEMRLVSASKLNASKRGNGVLAASASEEQAKLAVPPGTYSDSMVVIMADSTYYLRLSPDTTGTTWSTVDNYAKMKVVSIAADSLKVTLKLWYQKRPGFRWLAD
jgi:hypothetical protein